MWRPAHSSLRSSLRVVHATDIHFLVPPTWQQVLAAPKRLVGLTNLYLLKRASRFSLAVQQQLVASILAQKPDLVILSGDLTNLSLRSEFDLARRTLDPLLNNGGAFLTFVVPGNHDAYVHDAVRDVRGPPPPTNAEDDAGTRGTPAAVLMREYFGPWMESMEESEARRLQRDFAPPTTVDDSTLMEQIRRQQRHFFRFDPADIPAELRRPSSASSSSSSSSSSSVAAAAASPMPYLPILGLDFLRVIGLNPCRPTWVGSNGEYDRRQLDAFRHWLQTAPNAREAALDVWRTDRPESGEGAASGDATTPSSSTAAAAVAPPVSPSGLSTPPLLPFQSTFNLVVGHYPVLDGRGRVYEKVHKWHGVSNGEALIKTLQQPTNRLKPQMFVHGHVHRGFQDQLPLTDPTSAADAAMATATPDGVPASPRHQMLILNPGSSGQSFSPKSKRCASFNVYTIARGGQVKPESATPTPAGQEVKPKKAYPNRAEPPPFPNRPRSLRTAASDASAAGNSSFLRPKDATGALGGIQTVCQASADGTEKYYTSVERWTHDGEKFAPEMEPYTSGY